jgi:hypothetical protein
MLKSRNAIVAVRHSIATINHINNEMGKAMKCQDCEIVYINGVKCHERGCPSAWKDTIRECKWCGSDFEPEERNQTCCCEDCAEYYN